MDISQEPTTTRFVTASVYAEVCEIHDRAWKEHRLRPERAAAFAAEAFSLITNNSNGSKVEGEEIDGEEVRKASQYLASDLVAENYAIQALSAARAHEHGLTGFIEKSDRLVEEAEANLTRSAKPLVRARVAFVKAAILGNQFDYQGSEALLHTVLSLLTPGLEALADAAPEPEVRLRIDTLNGLGRLQIFQGAFRQGLETELRALDLARQSAAVGKDYPYGEAAALKNLAVIHQRLGDFVEATAALHRSLEITETLGDYFGKTSGLIDLANISMLIDEPNEAFKYLKSALRLARDHNYVAAEAIALGNIGLVHQIRGEPDLAIVHFETAVAIQRKINYLRGEAAHLYLLGDALGAQGRLAEARRELGDALAIHRRLGDRHGIASCLISLGRLCIRTSPDAANPIHADDSAFRPYLDEALEVIASTGSEDLLADVHAAFTEAYKTMGDFASALRHFESFHHYKGKMLEAHASSRTQALHFKYELEQSRNDSEVQRRHALELQAALEDAREQRSLAERLANEDILTGLSNRRHGDQMLASALAAAQSDGNPISLVFADVDHFKSINDLYSHSTGDRVLRRLADLCKEHCGPADIAVRYGGEELLFILPGVDPRHAARWAEELRVHVERFHWAALQSNLSVTLSLGIAGWSPSEAPILLETLLSTADAHLYEAKNDGRNRVRP